MSKRYMDFMPVKPDNSKKEIELSAGKKSVSTKAPVVKSAPVKKAAKTTAEVNELEINEMFEARKAKTQAGVSYGGRKSDVASYQKKFVKTAVEKRPLSKNVYQKKVAEPEVTEESKDAKKSNAPVTIIDKPEKESRFGLIMTIVITIILGAAAGVVAFLLLPK